jgi:thioester reductase-like protein
MSLLMETKCRMLADSALSPDIRFRQPVSPHALKPRAVCLTGATGFLGGYLLHELMLRTDTEAYCLVRAPDETQATRRLVNHLSSYGLWGEGFRRRIHIIPVQDLADPQFGMADDAYRDLARTVDAIYHSAGTLNMAFPYDRSKRTNVTGTEETIRFAATEKTKAMHFLSSLVVLFTDAHTQNTLLTEDDEPAYDDTLRGGYGKSKWVADRLVAAAGKQGMPATIHRPVRTMGTGATGAMNDLEDILPLLLKACVLLQACPVLDIRVTMVPVDVVTRAMVHLGGRDSAWGKAFHYFHPDPLPWNDLMGLIRDLGYRLDPMSYDDWRRSLKRGSVDTSQPRDRQTFLAHAFLATLAPHFLFYRRPPMSAANLEAGLRGTGIVYPPIDTNLIRTYFDYWRKVGFVPHPWEAG